MTTQNILPSTEQKALRHFLHDLVVGRTLVLLGSRGPEDWLRQATFGDNSYDLKGLDSEAASVLTNRILERYGIHSYREDKDLHRLVDLLSGFPLALEVVLANLKHHTPKDVLKALQIGDDKLNIGESQGKAENILRCIDYSYSNLLIDSQHLLMCLAPFTSVIRVDTLSYYAKYLRRQPIIARLPFKRLQKVMQEAQNWGLLSPDSNMPVYLRIQPTLPYFLRTRLHMPEQADMRKGIETAFREYYDEFSDVLWDFLASKDPYQKHLGQILTSFDYENLITALFLALDAQVSIARLYAPLILYLDVTQEYQRALELGQVVLKRLEEYSLEQGTDKLIDDLLAVLTDIAKCQIRTKQYQDAETFYRKALVILLNNKSLSTYDLKLRKGVVYHQLGRVAQEQRKWSEAEQYYQQASQLSIEDGDHHLQAMAYQQLGYVAQEQRKLEHAEHYYQQTLQINEIEYQNYPGQSSLFHQLGTLAERQRKWKQAEQYYQQALQIKIEYQNHPAQASTYHQFGNVALERREWKQAEQYYQQALRISIEAQDRHFQAIAYRSLGIVAQEQRMWDQAEQYYQQALQIFINNQDYHSQAMTFFRLGRLAQEQEKWKEVPEYYLQALEIFITYDDEYYSAITFHNLALSWQVSTDTGISAAIAARWQVTQSEVESMLRESLG